MDAFAITGSLTMSIVGAAIEQTAFSLAMVVIMPLVTGIVVKLLAIGYEEFKYRREQKKLKQPPKRD